MLESNPLKCRVLVRRLAINPCFKICENRYGLFSRPTQGHPLCPLAPRNGRTGQQKKIGAARVGAQDDRAQALLVDSSLFSTPIPDHRHRNLKAFKSTLKLCVLRFCYMV